MASSGCVGGGGDENTPMQDGFSWVIEDQLAGMPRPGSSASLDDDLAFLTVQGIDLLVTLTSDALNPSFLAEYRIEALHLPVPDFHPPTLGQQLEFVEKVAGKLSDGGRVGVHCAAGMGRTGTLLATFLVYLGNTAEDAIARVRELRPGSIETVAQEAAIQVYSEYLQQD